MDTIIPRRWNFNFKFCCIIRCRSIFGHFLSISYVFKLIVWKYLYCLSFLQCRKLGKSKHYFKKNKKHCFHNNICFKCLYVDKYFSSVPKVSRSIYDNAIMFMFDLQLLTGWCPTLTNNNYSWSVGDIIADIFIPSKPFIYCVYLPKFDILFLYFC